MSGGSRTSGDPFLQGSLGYRLRAIVQERRGHPAGIAPPGDVARGGVVLGIPGASASGEHRELPSSQFRVLCAT